MPKNNFFKTIKTMIARSSYPPILAVVAAFTLMVVLSSYFMVNIVNEQLVYNARKALDSLETSILTDLKEPRTVLGNQSEGIRKMILRGVGEEAMHTYLNEITEYIADSEINMSGFVSIYGFFEVYGGVLMDGKDRSQPENFNPRERSWYKEAVAVGGNIVLLQPRADLFTSETIITHARALFDNEGNLLGVVVLDVQLERIREYIIKANLGKLGFGVLLNEQIEFIAHVDPKLHGTNFKNLDSDSIRRIAALKPGQDLYEIQYISYLGDPSVASVRKMENGWYVVIVTPKAEYFSEVRNIRLILIVLGAVLALGFIAILLRIIDEKQKSNDAKENAIQANRSKSNFLARMSHEIRSPMNVILGIAEMQMEKNVDKREAWDKVYDSGYMLLNIINDILDLSKIEAGKLELTPVNYDVSSMINDSVQINILRFDNTPVQFVLQADENIPATLFGDDLRIKQVLNNILSNSFKYTAKGEISLSASAEVSGQGTPVILTFRIKDTGQGMTKEQVDSLFVDYSRFNMEANRAVEGTGLGMSITKHLVEMMNGRINIESELGKGSTFTIRLPQGYVDSEVLGKEGAESLQKLQGGKTQTKKALNIVREYMPYGKILIVDDMEPNLYVARGLLAPYGLSISTALSGYAAVDLIKSGITFDVIFMDHFMPKMDGMETTKNIRKLGYKRPIVALTANAVAGQAEVFLQNGFDGFISKPIDIRQLDMTLNKFVRDIYPEETVEAARKLKSQLEQNTGTAPLDLSYEKALVVDDFLPNLEMAAGMLQRHKMQVDSVQSGQEAIALIKKGDPEYTVIFMDHLMPEMDGIEATKLIRSLGTEYAKNIPIIAVTTVTPDEATAKEKMFLSSGFQAILPKPLTVPKVDVFIKKWMRDKIKIDTEVQNNRENNMVIEVPGIDTEKVMEFYAGDMKIYMPVLRSYLSVIPEALDIMSRVSAETLPEYIIKVHGLKNTSDGIGAEEARKMAYELEMLAKAGDLSAVLEKNGTLLQYVKNLLVNIQNWLAKIDA